MELHLLNARSLQADGAIGSWLKQGAVDADPCDQTHQRWPLITLLFVDTLASRPHGRRLCQEYRYVPFTAEDSAHLVQIVANSAVNDYVRRNEGTGRILDEHYYPGA